DFLPGGGRVHGDHTVPLSLKMLYDDVTRAVPVRSRAGQRDRLHRTEDAPEMIVGIIVVVHRIRPAPYAQRGTKTPRHVPSRFRARRNMTAGAPVRGVSRRGAATSHGGVAP